MATPLDALGFKEMYGRTLRRHDRGADHAFIVTPYMEGMTPKEMGRMTATVQHSLYRCVDYGEVHYVSAEMCAVLQEVVDRYLKDRTVFHFDQGDFPDLVGFVYFDGHIRLPTMYSKTGYQDLRAVLWDQFAAGPARPEDRIGGTNTDRPGLYFGGAEGEADMEVIGKVIYTVCDSPNPEQRDRYGPWKPRHWIPAQFGVRLDPTFVNSATTPPGLHQPLTPFEEEQDIKDSEEAMRTVFQILTAWTRLIQTEIPVRHPRPPAYDKVMHKEGRPPKDVKVTLLRRYSDNPPHGLAEVDWAYRWEVKGHYRWQRVGPNREYIRKVWVKKHVKGPPDKPLIVRDSVTALVR